MRIGYVGAVFGKEWRDLLSNRVLLGAVAFPAIVFAAIPTGLVAFIQARNLDPNQIGQIQQYIAQFPNLSPKLAAEAFIITNFMAYFLIIPAMVPMALATQSVIGEKQARSLEPQLATPREVPQQIGGFVVLPIIGIAVAQFFGGQATFTFSQVVLGDLIVLVLVGAVLTVGSWAFDRESILTRLG